MAAPNWFSVLPPLHGKRALVIEARHHPLRMEAEQASLAQALVGHYQHLVALDPSLRRDADERSARAPGLGEELAFEDASFDLVALHDVLRLLPNPSRTLAEARRVLRPGGILLLAEPIAAPQGTNQDHHIAAQQLLARLARNQGQAWAPLFQRLQLGSIIQGFGLEALGFLPFLADPAEAEWELAACQAAAAPWSQRLRAVAAAAEPTEAEQAEVAALAMTLASEGLRSGPVMIVHGQVPALQA